MMGHASIGTTLDVYGHLFDSMHEEVADRLDALYRGAEYSGSKSAAVTPPRTAEGQPSSSQ